MKAGTHSASLKKSHTRAHTAKQGASLLCNRAGHLTVPHQAKEQPEEADARLRRVSASSGTAAPLGCVIFFASAEVVACTPCAQCFPNVRDEGWYHYPRRALRAAETLDSRLSKRLICRFLRLPSSTPCAVTFSANMQISLSAISVANTFALWYDKSQIRIFRR